MATEAMTLPMIPIRRQPHLLHRAEASGASPDRTKSAKEKNQINLVTTEQIEPTGQGDHKRHCPLSTAVLLAQIFGYRAERIEKSIDDQIDHLDRERADVVHAIKARSRLTKHATSTTQP